MTYDIATRVSNNQSLTASGSSGYITTGITISNDCVKVIGETSLRIAGRDLGPGEPLVFRLFVNTTFTGITSVVVSAAFRTSDSSVIGAIYQPVLELAVADLVAGREYDVTIPAMPTQFFAGNGVQFIGLLYTSKNVSTLTDPTAGALSAWVPLGHSPGLAKRYLGNYSGPS